MKGFLTLATMAAFLVLPQLQSSAQYGVVLGGAADHAADSGDHGYEISSPTVVPVALGFGSTLQNPTPLGDDNTSPVSIGFSFPFFGETFTSVNLDSNGHLYFDDGLQYNSSHGAIQNGASDNGAHPEDNQGSIKDNYNGPRIDWNWDDLDAGAGGSIRTQTRTVAGIQEFVIDFTLIPEFAGAHVATVQTVLRDNGEIEMNFIDVEDGEGLRNGVAIGIQKNSSTYLQYGYFGGRSADLNDNDVFDAGDLVTTLLDHPVISDPDDYGFTNHETPAQIVATYTAGQVASIGAPANGETLLFSVVPEPASLALMAVAGLGLISFRRRSRS